jgi:DNA-binding MarR family transcriptional regulator
VHSALLTATKPELLDKDSDRTLRGLLYDYFAFGRSLDMARTRFARFIGLSTTQYLILIAISHFRSEEPMGVIQLAERLHLTPAFVANEITKLVADGLIEKNAHPSDGRRVQLVVTERGIGELTRLAALQRPVNDALFGMLTREEFKLLAHLLSKLAENGDRAARMAEHIEATLRFEQDHAATASSATTRRGSKRAKRQR